LVGPLELELASGENPTHILHCKAADDVAHGAFRHAISGRSVPAVPATVPVENRNSTRPSVMPAVADLGASSMNPREFPASSVLLLTFQFALALTFVSIALIKSAYVGVDTLINSSLDSVHVRTGSGIFYSSGNGKCGKVFSVNTEYYY
jgi:hypothetical protein